MFIKSTHKARDLMIDDRLMLAGREHRIHYIRRSVEITSDTLEGPVRSVFIRLYDVERQSDIVEMTFNPDATLDIFNLTEK